MGRFLMRLEDAEGPVFFEWSTVVDAPVSPGLRTEDELRAWVEATGDGRGDLDADRFDRLRAKGTSALDADSAEDVVSFNRAGPNETHLGIPALIAKLRAPNPESEVDSTPTPTPPRNP